jgi:hypothetical protein
MNVSRMGMSKTRATHIEDAFCEDRGAAESEEESLDGAIICEEIMCANIGVLGKRVVAL